MEENRVCFLAALFDSFTSPVFSGGGGNLEELVVGGDGRRAGSRGLLHADSAAVVAAAGCTHLHVGRPRFSHLPTAGAHHITSGPRDASLPRLLYFTAARSVCVSVRVFRLHILQQKTVFPPF